MKFNLSSQEHNNIQEIMKLQGKICLLILLAHVAAFRMLPHEQARGFGIQEPEFEVTNQAFIDSGEYDNIEMLEDKLSSYQKQFMEFDLDGNRYFDLMELKMMMEKLGQAKTHLELNKIIGEVDQDNSGTISYSEFLEMRLGKKSSVLKLILKFQEAMTADRML